MQQEAAVRGSRCRQVAIGEATNHYEASGSDGFNLSGSRGAHRPPLQSRQLHISIIRNSDGGRTVPPLHSMPTFIASKTCYPPTSYRPLQEQIPRVPNRYGRILRNYWTKFFSLSFSPYKTGIRGEISNFLELLLAAKAKNFDANHQTFKLIKTRVDPSWLMWSRHVILSISCVAHIFIHRFYPSHAAAPNNWRLPRCVLPIRRLWLRVLARSQVRNTTTGNVTLHIYCSV